MSPAASETARLGQLLARVTCQQPGWMVSTDGAVPDVW